MLIPLSYFSHCVLELSERWRLYVQVSEVATCGAFGRSVAFGDVLSRVAVLLSRTYAVLRPSPAGPVEILRYVDVLVVAAAKLFPKGILLDGIKRCR